MSKKQDGTHRARPTGWRGLCLVVSASLVSFGAAAVGLGDPAAASPPAPIPTCTATEAGCTPPDLLNDTELTTPLSSNPNNFYSATAAQQASLHALEQQAISNTLTDHHLPVSDTAAVETWGRSDALAELWTLVVQAIQATNPTTDQQNVVAWLTTVMQRRALAEADDAAWEFLKWAGLVPGNQTIPAQSTLVTDLNDVTNGTLTPVNYNTDPTSTTPTSGFCEWQPPAPYQNEYTGDVFTPAAQSSADSWCFPPFGCTSLLGNCNNNEPTYDQFVKYGDADVENDRTDSADAAYAGKGAATAVEFLGAGLGAGIAGFALAGALAPVLTGTALTTALFPWTAAAIADFGEATAEVAGEVAGGLAAAAVGAIVAVVIAAVAIAVLEGIQITKGLAIPGQLSTLIANAASSPPDLQPMLTDSQKLTGLFGVFIGASLPSPSLQVCDNSTLNLKGVGTTAPPCLNAPPIPAPASTDPQFLITPKGSSLSSVSDTLNWTDVVSTSPHVASQDTARITGNWFVTHVTDAIPTTTTTPDVQSLSIDYADWNGKSRTAWLVRQPDGSLKFLTAEDGVQIDPATCVTDGTCALSDSIDYQQYDSLGSSTPTISDLSATISTAVPTLAVSQQLGQAVLTEGNPATLNVSVNGGAGPFTEQWFFATPESQSLSHCTPPSSCAWDGPYSGSQVSVTPQAPGPLQGVVFVTDSGGRVYTQAFTFNAGDVGPTLILGSTDVHITDLGGTTTLTFAVDHAGSNDTENVNVDWGDGSTSSVTIFPPFVLNNTGLTVSTPSGTEIDFSGAHVYANAGPYTVTVSVGDGGGGGANQTTSETVNKVNSGTGLTVSSTTPVVGQQVTYTATVTASPAAPTGTVTFTQGSTVLCDSVALATTAPYTATCAHTFSTPGSHIVTASYNGDANYIGSTSSPVTITSLTHPTFTADSPPTSASRGTAYSYRFAASGPPAPTFALVSGGLPPGLRLDPATGILSGTPTAPGRFTFRVQAANGEPPDATSPSITILVTGHLTTKAAG